MAFWCWRVFVGWKEGQWFEGRGAREAVICERRLRPPGFVVSDSWLDGWIRVNKREGSW